MDSQSETQRQNFDSNELYESMTILRSEGIARLSQNSNSVEETANYFSLIHTCILDDVERKLIISKYSGFVYCENDNSKFTYKEYLRKFEEFGDPNNQEDFQLPESDENLLEMGDILKLNSINKEFTEKIKTDDLIEYMDSESQNYIIVAPPNTGKTTAAINSLREQNEKAIIVVPLRILANQISNDHDDVQLYLTDMNQNICDLLNEHSMIVTTYDSFRRIYEKLDKPWEYKIVIDEYHKLVSDANFRTNILRFLSESALNFKQMIGLTGTAFGCIDEEALEATKTAVLRFIPGSDYEIHSIQKYNICSVRDSRDRFNSLVDSIKNNITEEGLTVVFINDKSLLSDIMDFILEEKLLNHSEIRKFNSDLRNSQDFEDLWKTSEVEDEVRLLLTTSFLSSGININNNNVKNLYCFDEDNLIEIIQFCYRFRNGVENIYDFISNSGNSTSLFDLEKSISSDICNSSILANELNKLKNDLSNLVSNGSKSTSIDINGYNFYQNEHIFVDRNSIRYKYLKDIHLLTLDSVKYRMDYLKLYGFENVLNRIDYIHEGSEQLEGIEYLPISDFDIKSVLKPTAARLKEMKPMFVEEIFDNLNDLISSYSSRYNIQFGEKRISERIRELDEQEKKNLEDRFRHLWNHDKLAKGIIEDIIFFYETGIRLDTVRKIIDHSDSELIRESFVMLQYLPFIELDNELQEYLFAPYIHHVQFVSKINRYLREYDYRIRVSSFKSFIKTLPHGNLIHKYFISGVKSKFKYLFSFTRTGEDNNEYLVRQLSICELLGRITNLTDLEDSAGDSSALHDFCYHKYKREVLNLYQKNRINEKSYDDLISRQFVKLDDI